jgi:hypothetical protein
VPKVAATAAVLLEQALSRPEWNAASRPEAIKALLLAGARRAGFPNWSGSPDHPLDRVFGAGEVDPAASLRLLQAGAPVDDQLHPEGWTVLEIPPGGLALVPVQIESGFAAALCWLREIRDSDPSETFAPDARVPDHDLALADGEGRVVQQSHSSVDNVELIRHRAPAAGAHVLIIRSDLGGRVALAWRPE